MGAHKIETANGTVDEQFIAYALRQTWHKWRVVNACFFKVFCEGSRERIFQGIFYSEILKQLQLKTVSYFYLKFYYLENWFTVVLEFKLVDMFKLRKI